MNPTIEKLRSETAEQQTKPTFAQVRAIVDSMLRLDTLPEIADEVGLESNRVLDLVAALGTWLTHVHGKVTLPVVVQRGPVQPNLFGSRAATTVVTVPEGFAPKDAGGRDVVKAAGAVVHHAPDDDTLNRWIARTFTPQMAVLTLPVVTSVWRFATLGRLGDIDQVSKSTTFRQLVVQAYDLLEVARADAAAAIELLCSGGTSDRSRLRRAATDAAWIHEADMARLVRYLDAADADADAVPMLERELRYLAQRVDANPAGWCPATIADITEGQLLRIAARAGLTSERPNNVQERDVRNRLVELGLGADADQLVYSALRAEQAGVADTFWAAMAARAAGDPDWDVELEAVSTR